MSRVARAPIEIPNGVEVTLLADTVEVKSGSTKLSMVMHSSVRFDQEGNTIRISEDSIAAAPAMSGTVRANLNNMVIGVSTGFQKKLTLIGVGYRAQAQAKQLNLTLGFSHPVEYLIPEGITIETPSQTEILIKGANKQVVGQVAAEIRAFRPPEPYKGKGVRYADERVVMKEAKKK